jgi:hypothetical protein
MTPAHAEHPTKKKLILEIARELAVPRFTPAEVEQIRRQLVARLGAGGKTSADYIAGVLETAGMRIVWSTKTRKCASCASMSSIVNFRRSKSAPPSSASWKWLAWDAAAPK